MLIHLRTLRQPLCLFLLLIGFNTSAEERKALREIPPSPWNQTDGVQVVGISSSVDTIRQKAIWRAEESNKPRPLLVALHSWSGGFEQEAGYAYLTEAVTRQWHFIHPDFRGMNQTPEATCSDLVIRDILDAVDWCQDHAQVDANRIYLVGASGGGMAALMMAGRAPEIWAGVSSWVPITDLCLWHAETKERGLRYTRMIEASCGGTPYSKTETYQQYRTRSPIHHLHQAKSVAVDINAGILDGHTGSVPIGHAIRAYNVLAKPEDQLSEGIIRHLEAVPQIPESMKKPLENDPLYGEKSPLWRQQSGQVRLTLFDGGHEIIVAAAMDWLSRQSRKTGAPPP